MSIPDEIKFSEQYTVAQIIHDGAWSIPTSLKLLFPVVVNEIIEVQISRTEDDELEWDGSTNGEITVKVAYDFYREKAPIIQWRKRLWRTFIPPRISMFAWKVVSNRLAIGSVLYSLGVIPCLLCIGWIDG